MSASLFFFFFLSGIMRMIDIKYTYILLTYIRMCFVMFKIAACALCAKRNVLCTMFAQCSLYLVWVTCHLCQVDNKVILRSYYICVLFFRIEFSIISDHVYSWYNLHLQNLQNSVGHKTYCA